MTRTTLRFLTVTLALLILVAFTAPAARADELNINLTTANLSGFAPGTVFGTVNLKLVGNDILVTVTAGSGFGIIGPGNGGAVGLNVDGLSGLSFANVSSGFQKIGDGNMDGFGKFNLRFSGPTGGAGASSMSFLVSRAGGFTSVTQLGGSNLVAAIHFTGTNLSGQTVTGYASNGPHNVPEPGTLLLFGSGILMFGGALRRRLSV